MSQSVRHTFSDPVHSCTRGNIQKSPCRYWHPHKWGELNNLGFEDDIILFTESEKQLYDILKRLNEGGRNME